MKITKIETQKKDLKRYNIYVDGEFTLGVHEDVIVLMGLYVNQEIDKKTLDEMLIKEGFAKAKADAIKFIAYRMRCQKEVIDKLIKNGHDPSVVRRVLDFLKENALVNDLEFAKAFIHDKATISRHPMSRIIYDLRKKGIHETDIESAKHYYTSQDTDFDYENALILSYKKYKQLYDKNKYTEYQLKQRVYQYMTQKGYNLYLVKDALEEALSENPIVQAF